MALKLPIFKTVIPEKILSIQGNWHSLLSEEVLMKQIGFLFLKIDKNESLTIQEVRSLIDWHVGFDKVRIEKLRKFLSKTLESDFKVFELVAEYFRSLKQPQVVQFLFALDYFNSNINDDQRTSFNQFFTNPTGAGLAGDGTISYIENLYIGERATSFSQGQINVAKNLIFITDFSDVFEKNFDALVAFLNKCEIDFPSSTAKLLDRQLAVLIKNKESEVTAMAFRKELGYYKYKNFVESNASKLDVQSLFSYKHLLRLISKFEEAVEILSAQEIKRGLYWKSKIERLDGVMLQSSPGPKYRIAVAFFVGEFVFCDFGPTGNQIHIYDKQTFLTKVQPLDNWQTEVNLSHRLSVNKYPHLSSWDEKTNNLIREARRYD